MKAQRVQSDSYNLMLKGLLSHSVEEISIEQLMGNRDRYILLDARSPEEWKVSHIRDASFVGYEDFELDRLAPGIQKDDSIVVYCSVGYRSEKVAEQLQEAGYSKVYNLYGGIFEWVNRGGSVENEAGITQKVHPYNWLWGQWLNAGVKSKK